uniref:Variant surface glycoprotein 728 n=1 Tax=Trypanosoma brucei TaxID=5691 RepID=M4SX97_9TRYP|nr:variant surface glycoprotein 728 [Trypanosoma brucei]
MLAHTFLTIIIITLNAEAADLAVSGNVATACDEAAYAQILAKKFTSKLQSARRSVDAMRRKKMAWRIAAATSPTPTAAQARLVLAGFLAKKATYLAEQIKQKEADLQKAAAILYARAGATLAALYLRPAPSPKKTKAEVAAGNTIMGATTAECTITADTTPDPPACQATVIAGEKVAEESTPSAASDTIKLMPESYFRPPAATIKAYGKGDCATIASLRTFTQGDCASDGSARGSQTNVLTADLTFNHANAATPVPTAVWTDAAGRFSCGQLPAADIAAVPTIEQVAAAICTGLTTKLTPGIDLDTESGETLAALEEIQMLARQLLFSPEEIQAIPTGQQSSKIQDRIKTVFGTDNVAFKRDYLTPLTKPISFNLGNKKEDKSIKDIASQPDSEQILAHFLSQEYQRYQEKTKSSENADPTKQADKADKTAEKKEGDNKTTTDECTATEEGKYDKEKCTWNKEKNDCKVKEGDAIISAVTKVHLLPNFFGFSIKY